MNIAWFNDILNKDVALVGGKGASLGEMYNARLPIPPGFCITSEAYIYFLEKARIKDKIQKILKDLDTNNNDKLQQASELIKELIIKSEIPSDLKIEIIEAYDNLNVSHDVFKSNSKSALALIKAGRDLPYVAVRSSATAEDLPDFSFAGQQETFLNIKGNNNVLDAVKKCWASLFTARAIYYRQKNNFDHMRVYLSVVVQKMINSEKSGVMFTINPSTNNKDEIMIEAGFGLGEAIVSGSINPNNYIVNKNNFVIKSKKITEQTWSFVRDENQGKTIKRSLPKEKYNEQVMNDNEIVNLAKYGQQIEEHYKKPMDIEFAIEGGKIYIVQARPITTIKKGEKIEASLKDTKLTGKVILKGLAASPGVASGKVKLVSDFNELDKVQKGDIMVTKMTNPDFVPAMERAAGIVTNEGGATCHAAIVSRELGVPCVVGTEKATEILKDNDVITVDGSTGQVYEGEVKIEHEVEKYEYIETITKVKTITDLPESVNRAVNVNPDGIGLVRIEFMIVNGGIHPAKYIKDGRAEDYIQLLMTNLEKIAAPFKGKPIWVRTSDIRTDEYRDLEGGEDEPHEENPMIGLHGIRRALAQPEILKAEFEAIKRLHDKGYTNLGIMIPFLISLEELQKSKQILREIGLEPIKDIDFGVMVETPASVWIIEDLCKEGMTFISFGTNDLTQTTLGIDRNNEHIQNLYTELHPAVLRSIKYVIEICKKYKVQTSICGQAGSNPQMAEFLVNCGIDSVSVNVDAITKIRRTISQVEKKLLLDHVRDKK
ncbi:MAG: phosphoenolpyruvate synthase [archaeon]